MVYKKALIRNGGLGFLGKILNSRYNCGYEFKRIFIREIQFIYIIDCGRFLVIDICLIASVIDKSVIIAICLVVSVFGGFIVIVFYHVKSVSHLSCTTVIGRYK